MKTAPPHGHSLSQWQLLLLDIGGIASTRLGGLMLDVGKPCCSCRFLQLEPEASLPAPLDAAPPAAAPTATTLPLEGPPPLAVRVPTLPPVVLWVMPLHGSPPPLGTSMTPPLI